jgi:hypothetical protein
MSRSAIEKQRSPSYEVPIIRRSSDRSLCALLNSIFPTSQALRDLPLSAPVGTGTGISFHPRMLDHRQLWLLQVGCDIEVFYTFPDFGWDRRALSQRQEIPFQLAVDDLENGLFPQMKGLWCLSSMLEFGTYPKQIRRQTHRIDWLLSRRQPLEVGDLTMFYLRGLLFNDKVSSGSGKPVASRCCPYILFGFQYHASTRIVTTASPFPLQRQQSYDEQPYHNSQSLEISLKLLGFLEGLSAAAGTIRVATPIATDRNVMNTANVTNIMNATTITNVATAPIANGRNNRAGLSIITDGNHDQTCQYITSPMSRTTGEDSISLAIPKAVRESAVSVTSIDGMVTAPVNNVTLALQELVKMKVGDLLREINDPNTSLNYRRYVAIILATKKNLPWAIVSTLSELGLGSLDWEDGIWEMLTVYLNEKNILRHPDSRWSTRHLFLRLSYHPKSTWEMVKYIWERNEAGQGAQHKIIEHILRFPLLDAFELLYPNKSIELDELSGLPTFRSFDLFARNILIYRTDLPISWFIRCLDAHPSHRRTSSMVRLMAPSDDASSYIAYPSLRDCFDPHLTVKDIWVTRHLYPWSIDEVVGRKGLRWDQLVCILRAFTKPTPWRYSERRCSTHFSDLTLLIDRSYSQGRLLSIAEPLI